MARQRVTATVRTVGVVAVVVLGVLAAYLLGGRPLPQAAPEPSATPTPSPSPTPTETPGALDGLHVVLDPGHNAGNADAPADIAQLVDDGRGGTKPCNTVGTSTLGGYPEHAFTWDVAERTRVLLEAEGAEVTTTRGAEGVGPCVDVRGRAAAEAGADVLVSIHANGSPDPAATGFFAMVADPPRDAALGSASVELAGDLVAALAAEGFGPSTALGAGPLPRSDLATLNHAAVPAVMLELLEMRNPEEATLAESPEGRQRYAEAVAAGLTAWAGRR